MPVRSVELVEWWKMCSRYICTAVRVNTPITVLERTQQQGMQSTSSRVGEVTSGEAGGGSVTAVETVTAVEEAGGPLVVVRGVSRTGSVRRREAVSAAVGTAGYLQMNGSRGSAQRSGC